MAIATKQQIEQAKELLKQRINYFIENDKFGSYLKCIPNSYRKLWLDSFDGTASKTRALKAKCLECSAYQKEEIRGCPARQCPLWRYRPYKTSEKGGANG